MLRASILCTAVALFSIGAGCGGGTRSEPGPSSDPGSPAAEHAAPALPQGSEAVELDPADFVAAIDNPYWPMAVGSVWVYDERDPDGTSRRVEVTVTAGTRTILGIRATVVRDVVTEDGELVEDTYDWYAQDRWGNVWYLGEDTTEYENGKPVTKAGSWEAGVDGAQAGVLVPGDPVVGLAYRQEHYAGEAEDAGTILSLDAQVEVPYGSFEGALETEDTTPLDPTVLEKKYYARGVGPVLAVDVNSGSREELVGFEPGA